MARKGDRGHRGRKTLVLRPALQSNQSSLGSLHSSRNRKGRGPDRQVPVSRQQLTEEGTNAKKSLMKKKIRVKNRVLRNISASSKRATFERIIQFCLLFFPESNSFLSLRQASFRPAWLSFDQILYFSRSILNAQGFIFTNLFF